MTGEENAGGPRERAGDRPAAVAPIIMLDADGVITGASATVPGVFGYDNPAEMVGRAGREFWAHAEEASRAEEDFRSRGQWHGTFLARHRRGHTFAALGRAWLLCTAPGTPQTFMIVSHAGQDVHDLLGETRVIVLPEIVVRGAIHDLNNVVGVVGGALPLLRPAVSKADANSREIFAMVEESCARTKDLLREMGGWLRSWTGGDAKARDVDVGRLAVEAARLATIGSKIAVTSLLPESLWRASCDEAGIFRVLVNLALNARQAMGAGGTITVAADNLWLPSGGMFVRVSFSDTGPGMDGELLARVFDMGFTTKAGGSGIGLAAARHVVVQNGGQMEVESSPGRGTTFRVLLPAAESARNTTEPAS